MAGFLPWFDEAIMNMQVTGGTTFSNRVSDWSRRCDPFNKSNQSYEDRGGIAECRTFEDGTIVGKSYQLLFGGNGSGMYCSGSGETSFLFNNSVVHRTYGGSFDSTSGTKVSSVGQVHQIRSGELVHNSSKLGGPHEVFAAPLSRETTKMAGGSAFAGAYGGSVSFAHLNTFAAMGKNCNMRFDNICLNADAGNFAVGAQGLLALWSMMGGVSIASSPVSGVSVQGGVGGTAINYGSRADIKPGAAFTGGPFTLSNGAGQGIASLSPALLVKSNPTGLIHIQPGFGIPFINEYLTAAASIPGIQPPDVPLPPDPIGIG